MYLTIALIIITCIISYKGIKDELFLDRYSFSIEKVQLDKQYYRFITSGFLHVNWIHLGINMFVLYSFGGGLEGRLGMVPFFIIYITSLLGGNVLALIIHKYDNGYTSIGASGAISGLVFATIALLPGLKIFFFPAWIFGILYVLYTIYAIRSNRTDVGHAAHLGGALIGMCVAIMMYPNTLLANLLPILAILLPGVAIVIIMIYKPEIILIDKKTQYEQFTYEDRYNLSKKNEKEEVDRILEKINQKGISSLTKNEKKILEDYSKS